MKKYRKCPALDFLSPGLPAGLSSAQQQGYKDFKSLDSLAEIVALSPLQAFPPPYLSLPSFRKICASSNFC